MPNITFKHDALFFVVPCNQPLLRFIKLELSIITKDALAETAYSNSIPSTQHEIERLKYSFKTYISQTILNLKKL
jgi:hypothetical protein